MGLGLRALCFLFVGAGACSAGRTAAWERARTLESGSAPKVSGAKVLGLLSEAKTEWARRDDESALLGAIQKWEEAHQGDPHNPVPLLALSRAYYFKADAFLAHSQQGEKAELEAYQKGVDYGERALLLFEPEFEQKMRAGDDFEAAISGINRAGVPAAYWYCVNLGRFASKKGLAQRLFYKDKLRAAMERILEIAPEFFYGAADRYLGAFYALLPSIAGKDLARSSTHFEASLKRAPQYLPTRVVKAEFLAVEQDDEALYRRLLGEVLEAPDTDNEDIAPENRAAKRAAKKMLRDIDEVF